MAPEGRSIGGGHDQSAPTEFSVNLLKAIMHHKYEVLSDYYS
jgi:hypothetical protein